MSVYISIHGTHVQEEHPGLLELLGPSQILSRDVVIPPSAASGNEKGILLREAAPKKAPLSFDVFHQMPPGGAYTELEEGVSTTFS